MGPWWLRDWMAKLGWRPWDWLTVLRALDAPTRQTLWNRASRRAASRCGWAALAVAGCWMYLAGFIGGGDWLSKLEQFWALLFLSAVTIAAVASILFWFTRRELDDELIRHHTGGRLLTCLRCRYDLRGGTDASGCCPECGAGAAVSERGELLSSGSGEAV